MTRRGAPAEGQGDLFEKELFPVRWPADPKRPVDLSLRVKTAMGQILKANSDSIEVLAARIGEMTGRPLSGDTLYSYTAPSKPKRQISLIEFVAFVRITQTYELWDLLLADDGLMVLQGREAKLAQLGLLQQEQLRLNEQLRGLKRELGETPVDVSNRRGRR